MEASVVNCFVEGAFHILDTTASVKVKPDPPYIETESLSKGTIIGVLDIGGDITGTAAVIFTAQSILAIVSAMFGEEMTEMNDEIVDAVGEIGNMISGQVNTKMTEMGKRVKVKLADVKKGKGEVAGHALDKKVLVLPFQSTQGRFWVEVCY